MLRSDCQALAWPYPLSCLTLRATLSRPVWAAPAFIAAPTVPIPEPEIVAIAAETEAATIKIATLTETGPMGPMLTEVGGVIAIGIPTKDLWPWGITPEPQLVGWKDGDILAVIKAGIMVTFFYFV